ncbi:MAG: helix-turn-helix transcriptional regulator, partial [Solobacterium sp.]|nr:helix-turn-helix transcriptional regulator [Solobacterium sp.]
MDSKKTGQFIRKKRTEKNMTQKQLSEKMHVTVSAISQYENGKRIPDISVMEILCENLDISLTELIHGEEMQEQDEKEIREIIHF